MGKYKKPPVDEAIFDIRVHGASALCKETFQSFLNEAQNYQSGGDICHINIDAQTAQKKEHIIGYKGTRLENSRPSHMVHFMQMGMGSITLKPYHGWDDSYAEAMRLFQLYCRHMKPQAIARVATRFVNRFQFQNTIDPSDYFDLFDQHQPQKKGFLQQMSYQTQHLHEQTLVRTIFDLNINQSTNKTHVILDIDVFLDNLSMTIDNDTSNAGLKALFEKIRNAKNKVFETAITDKLRETFL